MHVIKARFRNTKAFLDAYNAELPRGGLFCPTTKPFERDEEVLVEINFPDLPNKMMLRGIVLAWRAALPRLGVRAGAMVAFDEAEEEKRDFLLAVANGKRTGAIKRRHARLPVEIAASWKPLLSTECRKARLRDISIGGAQLITDEPLQLDDDLLIEMKVPGGAQAIQIAAKVSNKTGAGYGVSFIYRDGGGSRRLREVVRRLINTP
jgi:Tfp pilus assembly protein PilZ